MKWYIIKKKVICTSIVFQIWNLQNEIDKMENIAMWVLSKDGKMCQSKFTTKYIFETMINEYNPPWETSFQKHINEKNNVVTFKEKYLRGNKYEAIFEGKFSVSILYEIELINV